MLHGNLGSLATEDRMGLWTITCLEVFTQVRAIYLEPKHGFFNGKWNGDEERISKGNASLGRKATLLAHVWFLILSGNPRTFSEVLHLDSHQSGVHSDLSQSSWDEICKMYSQEEIKLLSSDVRPFQSKMFGPLLSTFFSFSSNRLKLS